MRCIDRPNDRFQPGSPVFGSRFLGRTSALDLLLDGHRHALWLVGLRHSGKTSLLLELQFRTQDARRGPYTPLYVSLSGVRDGTDLTKAIASAVESSTRLLSEHGIEVGALDNEESAVAVLRSVLRGARSANRTLLLLLDDAESLRQVEEKDPVSLHRLAKTLASGRDLRTCLAADPNLGAGPLGADAPATWLVDFLPPLYVGAMTEEEVCGGLGQLLPSREIHALSLASGGHPYMLQLVASQCCSGLTLEQACAQVRGDGMVRDEVLGSLRSLSAEELGMLNALAREKRVDESGPSFARLSQLGLVQKSSNGTSIRGEILRDWLAGTTPSAIAPAPVAQVVFGPFDLLEPLGTGGMSQVYRALDRRSGTPVALKLLHPDPNADQRGRFIREARSCLRLSHPSIIQLYEAGEIEGRCFLAMELAEGKSLRERLAEGPMALDEVLAVALPLADALAHAHREGIVHRDIKPSNILIGSSGAPPKILDFGLAKILRSAVSSAISPSLLSLTGAGTLLGTFAYMSPEQAQGRAVDARTDQFSLGIVLYEMLAGHHPFQAPSTYRLVQRLVHDPATPLADAAPSTPFMLQMAIDRLLQKNPQDRYASTDELVELLRPMVPA